MFSVGLLFGGVTEFSREERVALAESSSVLPIGPMKLQAGFYVVLGGKFCIFRMRCGQCRTIEPEQLRRTGTYDCNVKSQYNKG